MIADEMKEQDMTKTDIMVSIVIVSWNVKDLLDGCLQSIIVHANGVALEVIVVDNASRDRTVEMVRNKYPWVRVIENSFNVGFARANNQAFEIAQGQYVLILNPDTCLTPRALTAMIEFMEGHESVGMVGPQLRYPDGEIQDTCARLLPSLTWSLMGECLKLHQLPWLGGAIRKKLGFPYDYKRSQEVEAISGATMFIRRDVLKQLNGFGETFWHCGEDIDLCYRVNQLGLSIYYLCEATVIHYDGQSRKQAPIRTEVNSILSIHQYFSRCFGSKRSWLYRLIVQGIEIPVRIFTGILKMLWGLEKRADFRRRLAIVKGLCLWRPIPS